MTHEHEPGGPPDPITTNPCAEIAMPGGGVMTNHFRPADKVEHKRQARLRRRAINSYLAGLRRHLLLTGSPAAPCFDSEDVGAEGGMTDHVRP